MRKAARRRSTRRVPFLGVQRAFGGSLLFSRRPYFLQVQPEGGGSGLILAPWMIFVWSLPQCVALSSRGLQIEDEILHVESQLTECFLHQIENPAAAFGAIDDPEHQRFQPRAMFSRQIPYRGGQFGHILGKLVGGANDSRRVHAACSCELIWVSQPNAPLVPASANFAVLVRCKALRDRGLSRCSRDVIAGSLLLRVRDSCSRRFAQIVLQADFTSKTTAVTHVADWPHASADRANRGKRRRDGVTEGRRDRAAFTFPSVSQSLRLSLLFCALLCVATTARPQLRDSFEGPELTWQLTKEADCGVRILAHDRPLRESHSGQSSEHFRLTVGNGTFVPLVTPIGRAPLIPEFRPAIFIKADRPSVQLLVRVVFPRNIDRGTGQPITSLLRGDFYTDVGQWQQLTIRDITRLLDQETRVLRTQFGASFDPREAYVDLIVLNAYSAPGNIDLWIDDLEISGY